MLHSPVRKVSEFVAHATNANCVTIGPKTGSILATGGDDKKVNVWRVGSPSSVWSLAGNSAAVECVCFDEEETTVASGSRGGAVKIYDLSEGRLARSLPGHRAAVTSMHHHPFGDFVVTGSIDTNVKIWDVRTKSCIQTYKGHDIDVTAVRFSPDGRWVASAAKNGIFKLWDLTSGRLLHQVSMPRSVHMTNLCFNPAEFILAAATTERVVRLYDMDRFELMGSTNPESGSPVRAMAFDSSGEFLLTATADVVRTWTWEDYEVPNAPKGGGGLSSVAGFGGSPLPARLSPGQQGIGNGAPGIGAGLGIGGSAEATPGTPAMATSVRCVRSADASWGRVSALWCDPNDSGSGSGRLVAASCQAQFCAAFEANLRDLGVEPSVIGPPNNDNADAIDHPYSSTARVNATVDETHGFHAEEKNHEDDFDLNGPSYQPRVAVKPAYGVDDDDEQDSDRAQDDEKIVKEDGPRDSVKMDAMHQAAEPKGVENSQGHVFGSEKATSPGETGSGGWADTKELPLPPSRDAPRCLPLTDLDAKGTGSKENMSYAADGEGKGDAGNGGGEDDDEEEYAADWEHASIDDDQQAVNIMSGPPPLLPSGDEESTLPAWMASLSGQQSQPQQHNEPPALDRTSSPASQLRNSSSNGMRQSSRRGDRPLAWSLKQLGPLVDIDSNEIPAKDETPIIDGVAVSADATWQAATAQATRWPEDNTTHNTKSGNGSGNINEGVAAPSSAPPLDLAALLPSNSRFPSSQAEIPTSSPPQSPVGAKSMQRKHETMSPADAYRRSLERRDGLLADDEGKSNSGGSSSVDHKDPKVFLLPEWISPAHPPLSRLGSAVTNNAQRRSSGGTSGVDGGQKASGAGAAAVGIDPLKVFGIGTRTPRDAGPGPIPRRSPRASLVISTAGGDRGGGEGEGSRRSRGTATSGSSVVGPRSSPVGHSGTSLRAGGAPSEAKSARNSATPRQPTPRQSTPRYEAPQQSTPHQRSPPKPRMEHGLGEDDKSHARPGSRDASSHLLAETRQALTLQRVPTAGRNVGTSAWVDVEEKTNITPSRQPAIPGTPNNDKMRRGSGASPSAAAAASTLGLSGTYDTYEGLINPPPRPAPPLPASPAVSNVHQSPTRISPPPAQSPPPSSSSARRSSPVHNNVSPSGEGNGSSTNRDPPSDDAVIAGLFGGYNVVESALSQRLAHLKVVGAKWRLGDGSGSLQHLHQLAESSSLLGPDRDLVLAVLSDFLGAADLIAGGRAGVLAVADAAVLLPLLASAFDAASQHQASARSSSASSPNRRTGTSNGDIVSKCIAFRTATASARAASALLTLFGATVRENTSNSGTSTCSSSTTSNGKGPSVSRMPGPVDVSADERRARCHHCKQALKACVTSANTLRHMLPRRAPSTVKTPIAGCTSSSDDDAGLIAALAGFLEEYDGAFSP